MFNNFQLSKTESGRFVELETSDSAICSPLDVDPFDGLAMEVGHDDCRPIFSPEAHVNRAASTCVELGHAKESDGLLCFRIDYSDISAPRNEEICVDIFVEWILNTAKDVQDVRFAATGNRKAYLTDMFASFTYLDHAMKTTELSQFRKTLAVLVY